MGHGDSHVEKTSSLKHQASQISPRNWPPSLESPLNHNRPSSAKRRAFPRNGEQTR